MCNNGIIKLRDLELTLVLIFSPDLCDLKVHMLKSQRRWFRETSFNLEAAGDLLFICFLLLFFQTKIFHRTSYNFSSFPGINHLWSFCRVSLGHGKVLSFLRSTYMSPALHSHFLGVDSCIVSKEFRCSHNAKLVPHLQLWTNSRMLLHLNNSLVSFKDEICLFLKETSYYRISVRKWKSSNAGFDMLVVYFCWFSRYLTTLKWPLKR